MPSSFLLRWSSACIPVLCVSACASRNAATSREALSSIQQTTFLHAGYAPGPTVFTDDAGHLLEERRYEPFGAPVDAHEHTDASDVIGAPDLVARDLNALNKRTDVATGWSDHGARWMTPETGRWLSTDPPVAGPDAKLMAAPWGLHPYQYAGQNPAAFWDPDGREPQVMDATDLAVQRNMQRLADFGHTSYFKALQVTTQGWKLVVADPSITVTGGFPRRRGTYDGVIFGANGVDAMNKVAAVTADGPIKRLQIDGHGSPGVQTLMDAVLWNDKTIDPSLFSLAGKFSKDGVLVFGGCQIMGGDDETQARTRGRLQFISTTLNVEVRANSVVNVEGEDELRFGTITACRGQSCVTAFDEAGIDRAWKDK